MHDAMMQDDGFSTATLDQLQRRIDAAMAGDRSRLSSKFRSVRNLVKAGRPFDRSLGRLQRDLAKSTQRREIRATRVPVVRFDSDLPILEKRDELARAIEAHLVVIVRHTGKRGRGQLVVVCERTRRPRAADAWVVFDAAAVCRRVVGS